MRSAHAHVGSAHVHVKSAHVHVVVHMCIGRVHSAHVHLLCSKTDLTSVAILGEK